MRAALSLVALVVGAVLVAEVTMQPATGERLQLFAIFVVSALVAAVLGVWMRTRTATSLRVAVLGTALAAVAVAGGTVVLAAGSMFLSGHDLRVMLVALGLGIGLAIVVATGLTESLVDDLRAVARTARRVGRGRRDERTGVRRTDEVGELAADVDAMIERLAAAEGEQARVATARRDFLVAVGHDLRTPLTSLRVAIEALQDGVVDDPPAYLRAMAGEVELLGALVEDLFLLARIESGGLDRHRERIDVAELAHEALEAVAPVADEAGVALALEADGAVFVDGSPRELRRVLRNLVANAISHSPRDGVVSIRVDEGDTATVEVHDQGSGFGPDFVDQAFDPFTRADPARGREGGAGLGLAIVQGLVTANGGSVAASPGPGGHVRVDLPLAGPMGTPSAPSAAVGAAILADRQRREDGDDDHHPDQ